MARNLYITSAEGNSGKSTVALGVLNALSSRVQRVGVFRPIARVSPERAAARASGVIGASGEGERDEAGEEDPRSMAAAAHRLLSARGAGR